MRLEEKINNNNNNDDNNNNNKKKNNNNNNNNIIIINNNNPDKKCTLIDVATPSDKNTYTKVSKKLSKYKNLEIEITRIWQMKREIIPVVVGALG